MPAAHESTSPPVGKIGNKTWIYDFSLEFNLQLQYTLFYMYLVVLIVFEQELFSIILVQKYCNDNIYLIICVIIKVLL